MDIMVECSLVPRPGRRARGGHETRWNDGVRVGFYASLLYLYRLLVVFDSAADDLGDLTQSSPGSEENASEW